MAHLRLAQPKDFVLGESEVLWVQVQEQLLAMIVQGSLSKVEQIWWLRLSSFYQYIYLILLFEYLISEVPSYIQSVSTQNKYLFAQRFYFWTTLTCKCSCTKTKLQQVWKITNSKNRAYLDNMSFGMRQLVPTYAIKTRLRHHQQCEVSNAKPAFVTQEYTNYLQVPTCNTTYNSVLEYGLPVVQSHNDTLLKKFTYFTSQATNLSPSIINDVKSLRIDKHQITYRSFDGLLKRQKYEQKMDG